MAYQGFGQGLAEDGAVIGKFAAAGLSFFVSTSFSKSFSLYGERVGGMQETVRTAKSSLVLLNTIQTSKNWSVRKSKS